MALAGEESRAKDRLDGGLELEAEKGYEPPMLAVIGSLEELTQGSGVVVSDTLEGQVSNGA
jgi:hypothetical protein